MKPSKVKCSKRERMKSENFIDEHANIPKKSSQKLQLDCIIKQESIHFIKKE